MVQGSDPRSEKCNKSRSLTVSAGDKTLEMSVITYFFNQTDTLLELSHPISGMGHAMTGSENCLATTTRLTVAMVC